MLQQSIMLQQSHGTPPWQRQGKPGIALYI